MVTTSVRRSPLLPQDRAREETLVRLNASQPGKDFSQGFTILVGEFNKADADSINGFVFSHAIGICSDYFPADPDRSVFVRDDRHTVSFVQPQWLFAKDEESVDGDVPNLPFYRTVFGDDGDRPGNFLPGMPAPLFIIAQDALRHDSDLLSMYRH